MFACVQWAIFRRGFFKKIDFFWKPDRFLSLLDVPSRFLSLREAIATWQSFVHSIQIATASKKPRNDNEGAPRNDSGKTAVHDGVRNRRYLAMSVDTFQLLVSVTTQDFHAKLVRGDGNRSHSPESLSRRKTYSQNSCVVVLAVPSATLLPRNRYRYPQIE